MRIELSGAVQFADKNFVHRTISSFYVVFEVEYLCNGWVKKDDVNANLV